MIMKKIWQQVLFGGILQAKIKIFELNSMASVYYEVHLNLFSVLVVAFLIESERR